MTGEHKIRGSVRLKTNQSGFPPDGLTVSALRVELVEPEKPFDAWISELIILGDLPWLEGETRDVEVRILTDEFRNHVLENSPTLLVRYGSQIIGTLDLCR